MLFVWIEPTPSGARDMVIIQYANWVVSEVKGNITSQFLKFPLKGCPQRRPFLAAQTNSSFISQPKQ
ncbi:unnamed protein product, partial [Iphiclides podalirius]